VILNAPAPFLGLEESWSRVSAEVATPMETLDWAVSCSLAFGDPTDVRVISVRDGSKLLGAAPMIRVGSGWNSRLEHAGTRRLCEPNDLWAVDAPAMTQLTRALVECGMPLILGRLPTGSPAIDAIKNACRGRGVVHQRLQARFPYIPLSADWREPEQNLSTRRRSDIRRARRQAAKLGSVGVRIFCPETSEVAEVVELAMSVEAKSWKGSQGSAMATDKPVGDFFLHYARRAARSGCLRVSFLQIGDAVAAMQIGVVHAGRFWVLKVGYNPAYGRASPGILLMIETIKYAVAHGLETYELLGSAADWTRVWTEHERESVSLWVYPANTRGAVALASDTMRKATRRLRRLLKNTVSGAFR